MDSYKFSKSQFVESLGLGAVALFFDSLTQSRERAGFSRKGKRFLFFPLRAMRASPHCTEKCVRQLAHICSTVRGSVRAATAGTVAPSHLLLTFGKLTAKFEMLCKKLKASSFKASVGRRRHGRWVQVRAALWAWNGACGEGVERCWRCVHGGCV